MRKIPMSFDIQMSRIYFPFLQKMFQKFFFFNKLCDIGCILHTCDEISISIINFVLMFVYLTALYIDIASAVNIYAFRRSSFSTNVLLLTLQPSEYGSKFFDEN